MKLSVPLISMALSASIGLGEEPMPRPDRPKSGFVPTAEYETIEVEGWTVRINKRLQADRAEDGREATKLLGSKLYEIRRTVPPHAVAELQKVPIWLGVDDGPAPCAEYHPSREWLADHGFNPDKAKAVEIGCGRRFLDWSKQQPSMVLHELAHAYHDRVLGFENAAINSAHENAVKSKIYDSVLRYDGRSERAYALTDPKEYFAEATEAYFGTNDFYPFVRPELKVHDPKGFEVVRELWSR